MRFLPRCMTDRSTGLLILTGEVTGRSPHRHRCPFYERQSFYVAFQIYIYVGCRVGCYCVDINPACDSSFCCWIGGEIDMVKLCKFHPLRSAAHDCFRCGAPLCKHCAREIGPEKWSCPEHEDFAEKDRIVILK